MQLDGCFAISQTIEHCILYSAYAYQGECVECEAGYFVALKGCVEMPAYCGIMLSDGKCVICVEGFELRKGDCQSKSGAVEGVYRCRVQNEAKCLQCYSGYVLGVNFICYPSIPSGCL